MKPWVKLLRPTSWVKNTLVFSALIFSGRWQDPSSVFVCLLIFVLFCLVASSLYIINDWRDRFQDRKHPRKKHRPLAAGTISGKGAIFGLVGLWCLAGLLFLLVPSANALPVAVVLLSYFVLILGYNAGLKDVAALDMIVVAVGILLRALAGGVAIGVSITNWFILAILFIALLLVAGKRRREYLELQPDGSEKHRPVLAQYSEHFLNTVITIMACASILTYSLYTLEGQTTQVTARWALPYSVLFVIFGILRYLLLIHVEEDGARPERIFVTDVPMIVCVLLWVGYILALFRLDGLIG